MVEGDAGSLDGEVLIDFPDILSGDNLLYFAVLRPWDRFSLQ